MRGSSAALIALIISAATTAGAQQSYPDLKGTWSGTDTGAFVTGLQFGRKAVSENVEIKLEIDQQIGKHLAGTISSSQIGQPFSGVIKSDGGILMS